MSECTRPSHSDSQSLENFVANFHSRGISAAMMKCSQFHSQSHSHSLAKERIIRNFLLKIWWQNSLANFGGASEFAVAFTAISLRVCMWVAFHDNNGNREKDENEEDNSDSCKNKDLSAGSHGNNEHRTGNRVATTGSPNNGLRNTPKGLKQKSEDI